MLDLVGGHAELHVVAGLGELAVGDGDQLGADAEEAAGLEMDGLDLAVGLGADADCTLPSLLPSDEKTARPISGLAFAGEAADLSLGSGAGFWAGGIGLVSGRDAGGGAVGEGVVWA